MFNYYDFSAIPNILSKFKVSNLVVCGNISNKTSAQISNYCGDAEASVINIGGKNDLEELSDFEAIFINDDANWWTVYNELNFIKKNNAEFPLVFIENNVFPNKRRDSYINPKVIPEDCRNEYNDYLCINGMKINTGLYHANRENTPHNGVLTAIEDFMAENKNISFMDIKFINGMIILYPKNNITYFRINSLLDDLEDYILKIDDVSDKLLENELLVSCLNDFKDEKDIHDAEINYKLSQIWESNSKIDLKDAQLKNVESKLVNTEQELNRRSDEVTSLKNIVSQKENDVVSKQGKINSLNNQIISLKNEFKEKENSFMNRESQLNNQLNIANQQISENISKINAKNQELYNKELKLGALQKQYTHQLSKLDTKEYCISCYQDEIANNHLEIEYLKKGTLTKKLLTPFAYLYLIFKSNPKEISLNYKLYKALKNSKCFDIGFYLNNNKDLLESKWCKYFSPELHYVCNGFSEERTFNKKYFNRNSKEELLDYVINCPQ